MFPQKQRFLNLIVFNVILLGFIGGLSAQEARENIDGAVLTDRETLWLGNKERYQRWYHRGLILSGDAIGSAADWEQVKLGDLRDTTRKLREIDLVETVKVNEWLRGNEIDRRTQLPDGSIIQPSPDGVPVELISDGAVIELMAIRNGIPMFDTTLNQTATVTVGTQELLPGGGSGLDLSGIDTVLGIWDAGDILISHQEFSNINGVRITDRDGNSANGISSHSTHVAGTLIAGGKDFTAKGMSYEANLDSYDWTDDLAEMSAAADPSSPNHLPISNHSYGRVTGWAVISVNGVPTWAWVGDIAIDNQESFLFGFYSERSQSIDAMVYDAVNYLPVWAASNERGTIGQAPPTQPVTHAVWENGVFKFSTLVHPNDGDEGGFDTLVQQGVAKNVLTVGSVHDIVGGYKNSSDVVVSDFSGFGPTDDGRIKPDLVGNGETIWSTGVDADDDYRFESGTSMATPTVTGSLNLLIQRHEQLYGGSNSMWSSTLKGIAIHSSDEAGDGIGPDYRHGWGLLNTARAAAMIHANFESGSLAHIKEVTLIGGEFIGFSVTSDGTEPLRITICWTDPEGMPPADAVDPLDLMLVNDLDLRVTRDSATFEPWVLDPANPSEAATTGDNFRDNVEQVVIANPVAGEYLIRVTHKGNLVDDNGIASLQNVSIMISGNVAQSAPELAITEAGFTGSNEISLIWPAVVGKTYQVQHSEDIAAGNWNDIGPQINASRNQVAVAVSVANPTQQRFYQVVKVE